MDPAILNSAGPLSYGDNMHSQQMMGYQDVHNYAHGEWQRPDYAGYNRYAGKKSSFFYSL